MTAISVVIPTYNRAGTLARALRSVFAQTRAPDEVIVVDDGSTDDTPDVVAGFPGTQLRRLAGQHGAGHARNEGVRAARGDWIAFLDSDDEWLERKLEVQWAAATGAPPADLVCTGITVRERHGGTATYGFEALSPDAGWSFAQFQNYPFAPSTWLIRRGVFDAVGYFDVAMPNCEDLDLLARMAGRHRMRLLAEPLVHKYNLDDSRDASLPRTAESFRILFSRHGELWRRAPDAAAASHVRLAGMYMRAGDDAAARAALWHAIRRRPGGLESWALLLASVLGLRWYERVSHRVARSATAKGW